eukprot:6199662-Pleurochrysis_carterae.AAC.1
MSRFQPGTRGPDDSSLFKPQNRPDCCWTAERTCLRSRLACGQATAFAQWCTETRVRASSSASMDVECGQDFVMCLASVLMGACNCKRTNGRVAPVSACMCASACMETRVRARAKACACCVSEGVCLRERRRAPHLEAQVSVMHHVVHCTVVDIRHLEHERQWHVR